jgi:hypothetical protein
MKRVPFSNLIVFPGGRGFRKIIHAGVPGILRVRAGRLGYTAPRITAVQIYKFACA